jgi:hypothetical protein
VLRGVYAMTAMRRRRQRLAPSDDAVLVPATVRFLPDVKAQADRFRSEAGWSLSLLVNRALAAYLDHGGELPS